MNLTKAVLTYNNTKHRELGVSPVDYLLSKRHECVDVPLVSEGQTACWKLGYPNFLPYELHQQVVQKIPTRGHSVVAAKFDPKYDRPYRVIKVNENGLTYLLRSIMSEAEVRAHHRQPIPWYEPPKYIGTHPRYQQIVEVAASVAGEDDSDSSAVSLVNQLHGANLASSTSASSGSSDGGSSESSSSSGDGNEFFNQVSDRRVFQICDLLTET